ncbi:MAG TPA: hypothetical protein GXZ35_07945 [Acholeplasmataceae bacterium]|nr:hypothetical protein [Acholeplasmataceae bacterium]
MVEKTIEGIVEGIINYLQGVLLNLISIVCIGVVGYILYQCIRLMFFGNKENIGQKILFGYFVLLLLRVFNIILSVNMRGSI